MIHWSRLAALASAPLSIRGLGGRTRLQLALGISLGVHALLLALHFQLPAPPAKTRQPSLDIVLVNAKSTQKPTEAQALAQANLDGGGQSEQDKRTKTPLPPTPQRQTGDELQQLQRRVQAMEARQRALLTQAQSPQRVVTPQSPSPEPKPLPPTPRGLDLADSARAMARLEGEISKETEEYNKRPRKKNISARTSEYRFAQYMEAWRQKIERVGTLNYPEAARGKLYGSLVLTVAIRPDGSVAEVYVDRSSGHKLLDDAARRIVQLAAPYAPFPPSIQADTDILEITRTWHFTQGDQLSAQR